MVPRIHCTRKFLGNLQQISPENRKQDLSNTPFASSNNLRRFMRAWFNKYKINFSFTNFPSFYSHWRLANGGKEVSTALHHHRFSTPLSRASELRHDFDGKIIYCGKNFEFVVCETLLNEPQPFPLSKALAAAKRPRPERENILSGFRKRLSRVQSSREAKQPH